MILNPSAKQRIWWPDFIRGIAIIMVVLFHLMFDLNYFYGWNGLNVSEGFWYYEGLAAAILFMSMVGVVTAIIGQQKEFKSALRVNVMRGVKLLGIGMLITLVSGLFFPEETVWFGILHLMGTSLILSALLSRLKWLNVILGSMIIVLGQLADEVTVTTWALIPVGLSPQGFSSFDYYPLMPWFGVILVGTGFGNIFYNKMVQWDSPTPWQKVFILLGKNSLWIYLLHLPLLYGLLWLILT